MKLIAKAKTAKSTESLGLAIGRKLKGGEVIELISDLGGGKTTFTRGLAAGAGSQDHVSSPTFTISNLYKAGDLEICHFDFYRLNEAGLMEHELSDVLGDPGRVVVVEWSDVVSHVLPKDRLSLEITSSSEDERTLTFSFPKKLSYLVEDL